MTFVDLNFWLLLLITLLVYSFLNLRGRQILLTVFSIFFYGSMNFKFLVPLFIVLFCDYSIALLIDRNQSQRRRKAFLFLGLAINVGLLFYYKFSFPIYEVFKEHVTFKFVQPLMPIGISFYIFQSLSYLIDVYDRKPVLERNFSKYVLYVTFFPQLVLGPIERAQDLVPQLNKLRLPWREDFEIIINYILIGVLKKVLFADNLNYMLGLIKPDAQATIYHLFLYSNLVLMRVYLDFSAYSDIARGLGLLVGVNIRENFRPYVFSKNPGDFWQRWHISLTVWIRTYIFLKLDPYKGSKYKPAASLFFCFLIMGIWHGASLNWLVLGIFHAITFISYRLIKPYVPNWPNVINYFCMSFIYAIGGYLYQLGFDTELFQVSLQNFGHWGWDDRLIKIIALPFLFLLPLIVYEYIIEKKSYKMPFLQLPSWARYSVYVVLVLLIFAFNRGNEAFVYFVF